LHLLTLLGAPEMFGAVNFRSWTSDIDSHRTHRRDRGDDR